MITSEVLLFVAGALFLQGNDGCWWIFAPTPTTSAPPTTTTSSGLIALFVESVFRKSQFHVLLFIVCWRYKNFLFPYFDIYLQIGK